jgi:hypothetical protein
MTRKTPLLLAAQCAVLLGIVWFWAPSPLRSDDTPIIVRDGSIVIESVGGDVRQWKRAGAMLTHPDGAKAMAALEVSGPGAKADTCAGRQHCFVEMTWSGGFAVRIHPVANRKGLVIESTVPFDDSRWDKSGAIWRFQLPADSQFLQATIVDRQRGGQATTICSGKGCAVRIHFQ